MTTEPSVFEGKNTEDALRKAADHFNLPLDQIQVEVLDAGTSGLLGLFGGKPARIRARPSGPSDQEAVAEVMRELTGEEAPAPRPAAPPRPAHAEESVSSQRQDSRAARDQEPRVEEDPEVVEASREVLERLVEALDDGAAITAQGGKHGIFLEVEGEEAGMLIGRRGQTLDALQYLTTRIVSHQQGRPVRINVDAGGYRKRRRENLEDLARRMADKARHIGRPVAIGPLTSPERRVVHLTLKDEDGLSTVSRGRGELKKVVISPRR